MQIWHHQLLATFHNPSTNPNPDTAAASRDTYAIGRTLNNHFAALLTALRATHDPAILTEIDRLLEIARAGLADVQPECSTYPSANYCTKQADEFLNWA